MEIQMNSITNKNQTNNLVMNVNQLTNKQYNQQLNINEKQTRSLAIAWVNLTVSKK